MLAPYAEQGEVLALAGDMVTMGYRSQLLFEHMEQPQAQQLMAQALSRTFGTALRVRNQLRRQTSPTRRAAPGASTSNDPVVRVAIRDYGARPIDNELTEGA